MARVKSKFVTIKTSFFGETVSVPAEFVSNVSLARFNSSYALVHTWLPRWGTSESEIRPSFHLVINIVSSYEFVKEEVAYLKEIIAQLEERFKKITYKISAKNTLIEIPAAKLPIEQSIVAEQNHTEVIRILVQY